MLPAHTDSFRKGLRRIRFGWVLALVTIGIGFGLAAWTLPTLRLYLVLAEIVALLCVDRLFRSALGRWTRSLSDRNDVLLDGAKEG